MGLEPTLDRPDNRYALKRITGSDTAAAEDTFIVVAVHMGGRHIDVVFVGNTLIVVLILDAVFFTKRLELTTLAADAGQAFSAFWRS